MTAQSNTTPSEVDAPKARRSSRLTIVTDSELQTFRSCPQLHHFKYRERLRPKVSAKPLAVGSIFHAGMRDGLLAGWHREAVRLPTGERVKLQIEMATRGIDGLVGRWAKEIVENTEESSLNFDALAEEVDQTAAMVKWMLTHYFRQSAGDLTNLVLVEAEMPFEVAMLDRRGRPVPHLRYTGVRDAVYYDPGYNQLVLDEHKTTGGDPRTIERRVEMDTQAAGYLHALREELKTLTGVGRSPAITSRAADVGVGRVRYNALRKALPRTPNVNKDGSVSVAACITTLELYEAALHEQVQVRRIPVSAKQSEFLENLRNAGDRFFARVEWHRSDEDIERWRSDTFVDASRIREAERNPAHRTRNPGHCNMAWSLPCSYRQICLDPGAPELRAQFRVIEDVHSEVRAAEVEVDAAV